LIYGARGTGKKTLARYILPKAVIVDEKSNIKIVATCKREKYHELLDEEKNIMNC